MVAPPSLPGEPKRGVDDFLAQGGSLLDLRVVSMRPLQDPSGLPSRERVVMQYLLSLGANVVKSAPGKIAQATGEDKTAVRRGLWRLAEMRAIEILEKAKPRQINGEWRGTDHTIRIVTRQSVTLGELGWSEDLLLVPRGKARKPAHPASIRKEWWRLSREAEAETRIRLCPVDQEPIVPARETRLYCSRRCQQQAYRARKGSA